MKILFLGYEPFLSEIIYNLKYSDFFKKNQIDILFAKKRIVNKSISKKIETHIKAIKKANYKKIIAKKDLHIYKRYHQTVLESLFPRQELEFLNGLNHIKVLPYNGLNKIENLSQYDFMIVASFGEKIPRSLFDKPRRGTLNIHPSYLPNLRGGYPTYIQAYDKDAIRGTTIHKMSDGWDDGEIVSQIRYSTRENLTNYDLTKLSAKYAYNMLEELHNNNFTFESRKQDEKHVTYCHKTLKPKASIYSISKKDDLSGYVRANIAQHIFPFTWAIYKGKLLIILEVKKMGLTDSKKGKGIFVYKKRNNFYIKHYDFSYLVSKYIYIRDVQN